MSSLIEQRLELANAAKECPDTTQRNWDGTVHFFACDCQGTGRVYLFPGEVRVPCPCFKNIDSPDCGYCQGRGWTPSANGWSWWQAVKKAGIWMTLTNDNESFESTAEGLHSDTSEDNPEQCFFSALVSAVNDKDIRFMTWSNDEVS